MSTAWHDAPFPRAFFTAVQFLTRLPVPGGKTRDLSTFPEDIQRGLQFFPIIGAAVGVISAAALLLFDSWLPFGVAVLCALAIEARVTGAFHEDAVADFCDAFGGGWTREDVLRILKDSRVGSYGGLGLIFAVGLRAAGLIAIADPWKAAMALVISGAMGRLVILAVMALVPPVPARDGLAKDVGQVADWKTFGLGLFWSTPTLSLAVLNDWRAIILVVMAIAVFLLWYRAYLIRRIGGVTGDCLGFAAYVGFIVTTLVLAREG